MIVIHLVVRLGCLFAVIGLVAALWTFDPNTSVIFPPCLFRQFTGLLCPGCGAARATHALVHAELMLAIRLNPLLILVLASASARQVARVIGAARGVESRLPAAAPRAALVAIVAFWVLRNLPLTM